MSTKIFVRALCTLGVFIFLASPLTTEAATYYISSTGSDTNNGTSTTTPWQTLTKVNATTFIPGDNILFKKGDTFYGSITVNQSGTVGNPITYGSYGSGTNPIITGFTDVTTWTNLGNNIWESTAPVSTLATLNMVTVGGVNTAMGRWPNADAAWGGYAAVASHTLKTSLTSTSLNSGTDWTGAEAVIKVSDWTINRTTILSQSGNLINIDGANLYYNVLDGYGFFIQNDIRTLDQQNEWYYNPTTKKLSMYSVGMPTSAKITSVENLFALNGSYITLQDIGFEGANKSTVYRFVSLTPVTNISIRNCSFNFSGVSTIDIRANSVVIDSNTIDNSNSLAIDTGYNLNNTITNNTITNSGVVVGMGMNGHPFSAVTFGALANSTSTVTGNVITNTGHNPITFGKDTALIAYNRIDRFNTLIDDGGGIYGGSNATITNNIVSNSIGALAGTSRTSSLANGIYLDDNNSNNTVTNNTVFNIANDAFVIHNGANNTFTGNTTYNSGKGMVVGQDGPGLGRNRNNTINNNIFIAKEVNQFSAKFSTTLNDLDVIGTLDTNVYARPFDDVLTIQTRDINKSTTVDLNGWKTGYGKDANSKTSPVTYLPYVVNSVVAGNKIANGSFGTNIGGVNLTTTAAGSSIVRDATVLDSGSLKVTALENIVFLINPTAISNTKQYVLRFTATSNVGFNLSVNVGGLYPLPVKIFPYRKDYEIIFNYPVTTNPTLLFSTPDFPVTFWLDNIVFTEASVTTLNTSDSIFFDYNATTTNKTVSLPWPAVDMNGTKRTGTVTMLPYTSVTYLKDPSPTLSDTTAPTVSLTAPTNNATISGIATLSANASDNIGVTRVDFLYGTTVIGSDTVSPYTASWNTTLVQNGTYTLKAIAYDAAGNSTTSTVVPVTVSNIASDLGITLTAPVTSTTVSGTIAVTAVPTGSSIARVDYFKDTDTAPFAMAVSSFTVFFDTTILTDGTHTFKAVVYNTSGASTPSAVVEILVSNGGLPRVNPSAPQLVVAQVGNARAKINWTPPASAGASAITSYTITSSPGNVTTNSIAAPFIMTGLANGTPYTFTVRANNSLGAGDIVTTNTIIPRSIFPIGSSVRVSVAGKLNVRSSPNGTKTGVTSNGALGTVLANSGTWTQVQFTNVTGWVSNMYLFVQ